MENINLRLDEDNNRKLRQYVLNEKLLGRSIDMTKLINKYIREGLKKEKTIKIQKK